MRFMRGHLGMMGDDDVTKCPICAMQPVSEENPQTYTLLIQCLNSTRKNSLSIRPDEVALGRACLDAFPQ